MKKITCIGIILLALTLLLIPSLATGYITLASSDISIFEGKTYQLAPHHTEENATFTYASDNTSVAPVDAAGFIRALKPGTANITITESLHKTSVIVKVTVKKKSFVYAVYVPPKDG